MGADDSEEQVNELQRAAREGDAATLKRLLTQLPAKAAHVRCSSNRSCISDDGVTLLMQAVEAGHVEAVGVLLAHSDVNVRAKENGPRSWTALHIAAQKGDEGMVSVLLAARSIVVDARGGKGETPLMLAATEGHASVVFLLVEAGAHVSLFCSHEGLTPLMKASQRGHSTIVQILLKRDPCACNLQRKSCQRKAECLGGGGESALMLAAAQGHVSIVQLLLAKGADAALLATDKATDALKLALQKQHWSVASLLAQHRAKKSGSVVADVRGALLWAVRNGMYDAVHCLVDAGAYVGGTSCSSPEATPVALAASQRDKDLVALLIGKGADTSDALVWAARGGDLEAVKLLHTEGAELDQAGNPEPGKYFTPLMVASQAGRIGVVEYLLMHGADVSSADNQGMTALMFAASHGRSEVAQLLIERGAGVNARDTTSSRLSVLMHAAQKGHANVVRVLLAADVDHSARSAQGHSAMGLAYGHEEVSKILREAGAQR